jgi:hypothetical protein
MFDERSSKGLFLSYIGNTPHCGALIFTCFVSPFLSVPMLSTLSGTLVEQRFRMFVNMCDADQLSRRSKSTMPCSLLINLQSERLNRDPHQPLKSSATFGKRAAQRTDACYHFEFSGRSILVSPALLQTSGGQGRPNYDLVAEHRLRGTVPTLARFMLELSEHVMHFEMHRRAGNSPMSLSQTSSTSSSSSSLDRCQWFLLHTATANDEASDRLCRSASSDDMVSPRSSGCLPTAFRYGIWTMERIDLCPERRGLSLAQSQRRGVRRRHHHAPKPERTTAIPVVIWDESPPIDCVASTIKPPSPKLARESPDRELQALATVEMASKRFEHDIALLLGRDGEFTIESPEAILTCRLRLRQQGGDYVVHLTGVALTVLADNDLCLTLAACANSAFTEAARIQSTSPERPRSSLSSSARKLRAFVTNTLRRRSAGDDENN